MAANTDKGGAVLWDGRDSREVPVGPGYEGWQDSYPHLGSEELLDHVRIDVECAACRDEGREHPYRLIMTEQTVQDVILPILHSCHDSRSTWRERDMHGLLARVARSRLSE